MLGLVLSPWGILMVPGALLIGLVPKNSPWGQGYMEEGKHGHPFYSAATFYTCREIIRTAEREGLFLEDSRSCLFKDPDADVERYQQPREGMIEDAGFVGMRFKSEGKRSPKT